MIKGLGEFSICNNCAFQKSSKYFEGCYTCTRSNEISFEIKNNGELHCDLFLPQYLIGRKINKFHDSIKKVIFKDPLTIVLWNNGDKTIVKCQERDIYDPEKGLAMAICKYTYGNKSRYNEIFKKWLPEDVSDGSEGNT